MAQEVLMDHIEARFHRPIWHEDLTPADSAASYETRLRSLLERRPPDVIMLGIGDDAHTASLFPGTRALDRRDSWYVANHVPQLGEDRLTATFPLLWSAELLLVVAVGTGKATALKTTFEGDTPAGMLDGGDASVEWYVDREAASLVS
jgi:6-phosphogluconolactonase